ncbi:MAG: heparan-alpha-glucosaminide N-acetyltransferase [Pseudomonadota bacterium]
MQDATGNATTFARVPALDLARTCALVGMVVFHVMFDLQMVGLVPPWTVQTGIWPQFAKLVAGSFLFLAGVSLWLAHGQVLRWHTFFRRLVLLAAAAALVSAATYVAMPQAFVYFGILHAIAVSSLIGLAVLRWPAFGILALAALVYMAPAVLASEAFNRPALWWTGLATMPRPSVDFEPILPWAAPCLAGLACAKVADAYGVWQLLRGRPVGPHWLSWPGRNSLLVYLVHQPVLIALIWSAAQLIR